MRLASCVGSRRTDERAAVSVGRQDEARCAVLPQQRQRRDMRPVGDGEMPATVAGVRRIAERRASAAECDIGEIDAVARTKFRDRACESDEIVEPQRRATRREGELGSGAAVISSVVPVAIVVTG